MEVKAFQWNVRPRWGRNFWKSVRCCVQLVFIMFVFSPIDGLSWVFHGYHADGCSYSLVFWESCTSLVARPVVQDSYKHRRILGRCYHKCLWGKARMGSAYHFNLLMYFLALRIGTRRSCLQLLLGLVSSSAPPLKALESNCSEKNAKACGYQRVCQET